jgi:subtilisin family serine protease
LFERTETPTYLEGYKQGYFVEDGAILIRFTPDTDEQLMRDAAAFIDGNITFEYGQQMAITVVYPGNGSLTQFKEIESKLKSRFPNNIIEARPTLILKTPVPIMDDGASIQPNFNFPNDAHKYHEQMNAIQAWPVRGATGEKIVVIDSGTNAVEDLEGVIIAQRSFGTDQGVFDSMGHGTLMSTIIGGIHHNSIGTAGISNGAKIVDFKVADTPDEGKSEAFSPESLTKALYKIPVDAKVVSISLAVSQEIDRKLTENVKLVEAVLALLEDGVIVLAGGGNIDSIFGLSERNQKDFAFYPAAIDGVLTIGAVDESFDPDSLFNTRKANGEIYLDMVAPGVNILAQAYIGVNTTSIGSSSPATALVAGAASIIAKKYPDHTQEILLNSAGNLTDPLLGAGYLDLEKATLCSGQLIPDTFLKEFSYSIGV